MRRTLNNVFREKKASSDAIEQPQSSDTSMSDVVMGYEYYDLEKSDIHEVIKEADSMMYENKR